MEYLKFVELYDKLSKTAGRLNKTEIISDFLKSFKQEGGKSDWIYLLLGKIVPDYDSREIGVSTQLTLKAITYSFGAKEEDVLKSFKKIGDLGEVAFEFAGKKKQSNLGNKSKLSVEKVFGNLKKMLDVSGNGAIDKKMDLISELLGAASPLEAKYIVRTLLSDLRIGVSSPTIVESIALAFYSSDRDKMADRIQEAYDLANDFSLVFDAASKSLKEIEKINLEPGKPVNVMLAVKVTSIDEAFEVCGRPAAIEQKYDGFRMLINNKDGKISLFTRRLENVTNQFPDVVLAVSRGIKGDNFILDAEVVGFNSKTKKYMPFEAISQRIKRKYDIEKLVKELPVEINVFDVLYYNGKTLINEPFSERRKIVEKIVIEKELVIRPAVQIITDSDEEALEFYRDALKLGEEGIMVKKLDAPYKQGRKVGYMVKLKPLLNDIDLVIVGAEHGTGKRGGWLTSYIVACRDEDNDNELVEVGKVSSGLKEIESEEGTTYDEMTKLLKPLIIETKEDSIRVKPKVVVSVNYQNIQESPSYSSGFALRFPRITHYRPDRKIDDIATLSDIKKVSKQGKR